MSDLERFYSHIITDWKNNPDECWETDLCLGSDGYPRFQIKETDRACRASYILHKGSIPSGLLIRHTCNNPKCINPNHLLVGTYQENRNDCVLSDRQAKGSINGNSKLTEDQVREILTRVWNGEFQNYAEIGKSYNVEHQTIGNIFLRLNWTHITDQLTVSLDDIRKKLSGKPLINGRQKLTEDDVKQIKIKIHNGETNVKIGKDHSIDKSIISHIRNNHIYQNINP